MQNYMDCFRTNIFAFSHEKNIIQERHLGICSNIASIMTPYLSVTKIIRFQGCPYTNTGFSSEIILNGESVRCSEWVWLPNALLRRGRTDRFHVESLTAVAPNSRTVIQKITVTNTTQEALKLPLQLMYRGQTYRLENWDFPIPKESYAPREDYSSDGRMLSAVTGEMACRMTTSLPGMQLFRRAYLCETTLDIPAGAQQVFYLSAHIGTAERTEQEALYAMDHYETLLESSFEWLEAETQRIYRNLPRLETDDPALDRLYYRSLVTYLLCRWDNPDLFLSPFYSTGSVNGACMCSYLWNYCGGLKFHPIFDPTGNKEMLRAYLKLDLTASYALDPVTGGPVGPWYMINQEKIIRMVYYHVLFTGDKGFLHEMAGDRTVIEWMKFHAYVCDDLSKDVDLYDYGEQGSQHLEIHFYNNGPYNGIMPDLNARRYRNYMLAYELTKVAGEPDERLPQRAAQLKEKMKSLWNEDAQWYDFIDAEGNRDIRYTAQMFKFINSGVLDKKERDGLVSHLNDREFLSWLGIHSMSKLDSQYDQDDIDNGGGGICVHFVPQICMQLYETGYSKLATDIFRRVYWWGERMPYMGDSFAANMILNREVTPLQGDIGSVGVAQMIALAVFGIHADFDGNISISPVKETLTGKMKLENMNICEKTFCVEVTGNMFSVIFNGQCQTAAVGEEITI